MTIETVATADPAAFGPYDAIIDVRSPAEFAEDHVPGAINLPVLSNEERAEVGTIYVQESRFRARRIGAAMIARNVARYLEGELKDKDGAFRPLIYCWRGGQRSNAMAVILSSIGWRTGLLEGGYRTYRRRVSAALYGAQLPHQAVLIDGPTGSGKTELLARLAHRGLQTLDLEGLAAHRGSLFGSIPGQAQPSQKLFESRLLAQIEALDPNRPVLIEAESSKIGERVIPPALWRRMELAPRIAVAAPREARARYLVAHYGEFARDRAALEEVLARVPERPGRKRLAEWRALADASDYHSLAEALIERHYDPAYRRAGRKAPHQTLGVIDLPDVGPSELDVAAGLVAELVGEAAMRPRMTAMQDVG